MIEDVPRHNAQRQVVLLSTAASEHSTRSSSWGRPATWGASRRRTASAPDAAHSRRWPVLVRGARFAARSEGPGTGESQIDADVGRAATVITLD